MLCPTWVYAEQSVRLSVNAELYSEPVSVHAFLDDWETSNLKKGKNAFASGKMKLETQKDNWTLGWVWSYDYPHNVVNDGVEILNCTTDKYCNHLVPAVYPTPFYETLMCLFL